MTWRYTGASCRGTRHDDQGLPCQDAHLVETIAVAGEEVLIAVVCDGAGSARHSEVGATLICETILGEVQADVRAGLDPARWDADDVRRWLQCAVAALDTHAALHEWPVRDLAATCLGVVSATAATVAWQVGDGAVVLAAGGDGLDLLTWPVSGQYVNMTTFLDAAAVETAVITRFAHRVERIAMLSDGLQTVALDYATRSASPGFFQSFFAGIEAQGPGTSLALADAVAEVISRPQFLARIDDDRTLVIASRRGPSPVDAGPDPRP